MVILLGGERAQHGSIPCHRLSSCIAIHSPAMPIAINPFAHAPQGNVSLKDYPNVRAWLQRIEALPGFLLMQRTAAGLQAS